MYTPNVGGVLTMLLASARSLKLQSLLGVFFCFAYMSLRTIASTRPDGPRFFCAPPYTSAHSFTGCGRERNSLDASTMRLGCFGHVGRRWPCTVSLVQTWK